MTVSRIMGDRIKKRDVPSPKRYKIQNWGSNLNQIPLHYRGKSYIKQVIFEVISLFYITLDYTINISVMYCNFSLIGIIL